MVVCKFGILWKSMQGRKVPWFFVTGIKPNSCDGEFIEILFWACDDTSRM